MIPQDLIPEEKRAAVTRALEEAFGVTTVEDIRKLTGGNHTTLKFRIVVRGAPYLLRIIMRKDPATRHFNNLRVAAAAGLTPSVWYTNAQDKISITDFVDVVPLPVTEALVRMPAALRMLHDLPPFDTVPNHINTTCMFLINMGLATDGFVAKFRETKLLPAAETNQLFALYDQLAAAYPHRDANMVSSHNDLKPENVVFDGQRMWLVDWEAAFLNDRYNDLAVFANFVVTSEAEESAYLTAYFGREPDDYERARFLYMQQVVHIFYTMGYLFLGSRGQPVEFTENVPEFREFHRRIWAGEVDMSDSSMKIAYGRTHWQQLLDNVQKPRFRQALRIVAEGSACA